MSMTNNKSKKFRTVRVAKSSELFNQIKIIFFGTPEFAKIVLEKIVRQDNLKIVTVVTAPDKPVGRKQILTPPPSKVLAQENNILVLQPVDLSDQNFIEQLKLLLPDLIVVAAYGKIIPKNILDIPKFGSLNVHPSLLPKYRGASPTQAALLNGETETGVTIMLMDEKVDHGPVIADCGLQITDFDTYETLSKKLAEVGAELLIRTIPNYTAGKIKPVEQDHNKATYYKMIKKSDGEIDWQKSATEIYNQWRAFYPWPGVFAQQKTNNKKQTTIKFIEIVLPVTQVFRPDIKPGEFFILDPRFRGNDNKGKKLYITCGNNSVLEIKKIQPEGKKVMTAQEFINGYLKI